MLKLAIVGRPNVGKSTLFNRLTGKRAAIVHDTPGVTRDRREGEGRIADLRFTLIDTAGFEDVGGESLEARMRAQTEAAIAAADVVLLVFDARTGVTPADEGFAELLRKADKPILVLANKCEGKAGDAGLMEAYGLGLGEPIALSAEHGEGLEDLYPALRAFAPEPEEEVYVKGKHHEEQDSSDSQDGENAAEEEAPKGPLKLAIIGRPNAGKSTLVNALLRDERMLTGPEAGITRDAITLDWEWRGHAIRLIDTAGMRRKARVQTSLEQMSVHDTLNAIRFADVCVLVMDEAEAFEHQDLAIADLVLREGRALVFAIAKWDKAAEPHARYEELKADAREKLPQARGAPFVAISALAGAGLDALMRGVLTAYGDWNARVKTSDLNNWLRYVVERHPPPAISGRRIKPRYMTQIKARPPTFLLFASRAEAIPDSYKRYLINELREAFHLNATPIRLNVRGGKNPYADRPSNARQPRSRAPTKR